MERHGIPPDNVQHPQTTPGELLVLPENNSNVQGWGALRQRGVNVDRPLYVVDVVPCPWLATMDYSVGAGFYAGVWGSLPCAFGRVQPARYRVVELGPAPRSLTFFQSNFMGDGVHGNFEVIVRVAPPIAIQPDHLDFWFLDSRTSRWNGPCLARWA